ncbi:type VII secretion-associated serine protease mycosin [Micromonospora sp. NPDC003197]
MRVVPRPAAALSAFALSLLGALALPAAPAAADEVRDRSWHLDALGLAELHKITQGEGVTVAVIDTGVDATHPDLKNNVLSGVDLHDEKTKGRVDRQGHGTAMASLIAGHGHGPGNGDGVLGIAPKAKILPVTVQSAKQGIIAPDAVAAGIDWAVDHGADVINVSLSSSSDSDLDRAVDRAYKKNVIVVASVGNRQDLVIGNPARHPGAIAVTGSNLNGELGPESIPAEETDIAAPSVDLQRAVPGGGYSQATSVSGATAIVSGAVALIRAKYPNLSAFDTFKRLLETTKDAGASGRDPDFGWGVLDLRQALTGEPDGRANSTNASPTATPDPLSVWQHQDPDEDWYSWLILGVLLLLVAVLVVVVVLVVRRRRRRHAVQAAVPDVAGPLSAGPPAAGPSAGKPRTPADDSVWRPPAR